ncbi:asparagine synthase-related protein [Nostoc sp.]|uniref:asparagine synthase-related protein n=1 Tax=Nostoc sp. TaxID=1180 RepID=UPI00359388C7
MLFNIFKNPKSNISSIEVIPTWYVIWGTLNNLTENVLWQDDQFAIISALATEQFALSPTKQFVVVGDVWLTNRVELLQTLGVEPSGFLENNCQLIAQLWEKFGSECLKFLVGMFGLVVWDRQQQVLWLGRDRIGSRTLYYTTTSAIRAIAPKMRALTPYRSTELDLVALRDYLCCAFVPGERTLWQQVKEVRPGTVVEMPSEKVYTYWELEEEITSGDQLFDQRVVDLSMQIPPEYKLSGVEEKAVLKQAVADILPQAIIHRPKSGMMVPVQMGFRKY